jgi:methionyl-tRNA formyltransferase
MRIIFMGTPEPAVPTLKQLIEQGHEVLAVFTQPDRPVGRHQVLTPPPVKLLAEQHGMAVYQPEKIKNNEEVRQVFQSLAPDLTVVVAYGRILPPWLLAIPKLGCVNVHFSLLPKYRGAAPVNWAIARGEPETGVTTMLMDEGMDTGPILLQRKCELGSDETAPELMERLALVGAELLSETLEGIQSGSVAPVPQDHSQATSAPMLKREDGLIDWNLTAQEIRNRLRGFQPWPGAWTMLKGTRLMIWRAEAEPGSSEAERHVLPGTLSEMRKDAFAIGCGGGSQLIVKEVQLEGKKRLGAGEFLRGAHLEVGVRLGES